MASGSSEPLWAAWEGRSSPEAGVGEGLQQVAREERLVALGAWGPRAGARLDP